MKYTKNELKSLIKECLIEILADGLGGRINEVTQQSRQVLTYDPPLRRPAQQRPALKQRERDPILDSPVRQNQALREAIKHGSGGDPLLASMLADTARTTLQEQLAAESSGGGESPKLTQQEQVNGTPEELFGEDAASKWAELAFAPSRPGQRASS